MREHPITKWMRANKVETQAEAARQLGLRDQQEVSDYVTWRHVPRPNKMREIAKRVGCNVASLIPDTTHEEGAA